MSVVQTEYPNFHEALVDGQVADTTTCTIDSGVSTDGDDIPFGRALIQDDSAGAGDRDMLLGMGLEEIGTLNGAITAAATSLTLNAAATVGRLRPGDYLLIDTEVILIDAEPNAAGTTYGTVIRGEFGTAGGAHVDDSEVYLYRPSLFRGLSVQDERLPASNLGKYKEGDEISVMARGDLAVKVSAAVAANNPVVAATAASGAGAAAEEKGQLSTKAPDATHILLPNVKFLSSAAAQGIAVVRITPL